MAAGNRLDRNSGDTHSAPQRSNRRRPKEAGELAPGRMGRVTKPRAKPPVNKSQLIDKLAVLSQQTNKVAEGSVNIFFNNIVNIQNSSIGYKFLLPHQKYWSLVCVTILHHVRDGLRTRSATYNIS